MSNLDSTKRWKTNNPEKVQEYQKKSDKKYYNKNKDVLNKRARERRNVCGIIKKHHEDMKDDPERLTIKFIKSIVNIECGD